MVHMFTAERTVYALFTKLILPDSDIKHAYKLKIQKHN